MRRALKWLLVVAVLGGGAAAAVPAVQRWRKRAEPRYTTAKVGRGRVETVVNSTGTLKPVKSISVGSFVSGPIKKIYVDFNSRIKEGELLAEIDEKLPSAAVKRDRATLKTAEADRARVLALLQQAKNNEKRARNLVAINKDYLSDTEADQVRFNRESLEAQLALAEAAIEQASATLENSTANLGYTKIRSPVNGIVIERKVDDGQTVASAFQTPEMFIVAPDMDKAMHVFASVDEADIGQIRLAQERGRPVRFTVDAYPQEMFEGRIHQVRKNSTTTQNVVTYPVVIETPNPELKLLPGMTANITFLIDARDDVRRLPVAALRFVPPLPKVRPQDRKYLEGTATTPTGSGVRQSADDKVGAAKGRSKRIVWVQEGEMLRAVPVTLGASDNRFAELVEGDLEEGQAVVTGLPVAGAEPQAEAEWPEDE